MPTSVLADDDEQIIADLQCDVRRLRSRLATTAPRGGHDAWTAAATPATTYQLSVIPVLGTCEFAINGHEQREGTDYTCDYDTGIVTVSASLASGDKLVARYLITDWLVARTLPEDTGIPTFVASSSAVTSPSSVTSINVTVPASTQVGDVIVIAAAMHDVPLTFNTPTGYTLAQDVGDNVSRLTAWYKVAVSGDIGATVTVNITGGGSEWPAVLCLVYRNIHQTTPLVASGSLTSGTATPWPTPTRSAGSTPAVGVYIWGTFRGTTTYPITSFGSGTGRVDVVGTGREIAAADKSLAAGASGSGTATPTAAQEYCAFTLVFQAP